MIVSEKNTTAVIFATNHSTGAEYSAIAGQILAGQNFLERLLWAFRQGGIERIIVVSRYGDQSTAAIARSFEGTVVCCHTPDNEMLGAVKTGIMAVREQYADASAILLCPAEAALLMPRTIASLLKLYALQICTEHQNRIIIPLLGGRTGYPALIPAAHFDGILGWEDSGYAAPLKGLRGYYNSIMSDFGPDMHKGEYLNFLHPDYKSGPHSFKGRKAGHGYAESRASVSAAPVVTAPIPDAGVISNLHAAAQVEAAEELMRSTANRALPSLEEAWELLRLSRLSDEKLCHCVLVARAGLRLGIKLMQHDIWQNLHLIVTAGLLHDLLRFDHNHAFRGYEFLRYEMGWPHAGFVVGCHTVLPQEYFQRIGVDSHDNRFKTVEIPPEAKTDKKLYDELFYAAMCVHMADKYAMRNQFASIGERFDGIRQWFKTDPQAIAGLDEREAVAEKLEAWFSGICGCTLLKTVTTSAEHPLEDELARVTGGIY